MKEFFEDFDPLRLGTVSQARFIRVLASLGLTGLDGIPLTEAQMHALCNHYRHPEQRDLIIWKQFEQDVESGLTRKKQHIIEIEMTNILFFVCNSFYFNGFGKSSRTSSFTANNLRDAHCRNT